MDGRRAADHADGGELGDLVGKGHEVGDWAEGLVGEGGVKAGEDDALAEVNEFHGEMSDAGVVGVTMAASWVWELWLAMAVRW